MDEPLDLGGTPVSRAIFRVARLHKALAGQLLRETGLHPGQELVLMTLWSAGPQRLVDLVQAVESDAPTMTRSIGRMEKAGLVRRRPSPTDRRAVIVEATDAGLALRAKVEDAWAELERLTVAGLSRQDETQVLEALSLLEASLDAVDR
jgi:DNA-binding MarR family transcriptional regulator